MCLWARSAEDLSTIEVLINRLRCWFHFFILWYTKSDVRWGKNILTETEFTTSEICRGPNFFWKCYNPAKTSFWTNVDLLLVHRLRRWPNIKTKLGERIGLARKLPQQTRHDTVPVITRHWANVLAEVYNCSIRIPVCGCNVYSQVWLNAHLRVQFTLSWLHCRPTLSPLSDYDRSLVLTINSLRMYHSHFHPLQAANCCRNARLVVDENDMMWFKNSRKWPRISKPVSWRFSF